MSMATYERALEDAIAAVGRARGGLGALQIVARGVRQFVQNPEGPETRRLDALSVDRVEQAGGMRLLEQLGYILDDSGAAAIDGAKDEMVPRLRKAGQMLDSKVRVLKQEEEKRLRQQQEELYRQQLSWRSSGCFYGG